MTEAERRGEEEKTMMEAVGRSEEGKTMTEAEADEIRGIGDIMSVPTMT